MFESYVQKESDLYELLSTSRRCFECVMRPKCGFCTNHEGSGGSCLPQSDGNTTMMMTTMSIPMSSHLQCSSSSSFSMNSCDAGGYPGWISVLLLVFYLACFAPGMGPIHQYHSALVEKNRPGGRHGSHSTISYLCQPHGP